jgi:hypothetical protein
MPTAIVVLLSGESSVNEAFVAIRKEIDKNKFESFDFLAFYILFSHGVKNSNDLPIRSSFIEAIWDVSLVWWMEINVL